jgi:hypothetical protein
MNITFVKYLAKPQYVTSLAYARKTRQYLRESYNIISFIKYNFDEIFYEN